MERIRDLVGLFRHWKDQAREHGDLISTKGLTDASRIGGYLMLKKIGGGGSHVLPQPKNPAPGTLRGFLYPSGGGVSSLHAPVIAVTDHVVVTARGMTVTATVTSDEPTVTVDWGDGSPVETLTEAGAGQGVDGTATATHTYASPGDYTVTSEAHDPANPTNKKTDTAVAHIPAFVSLVATVGRKSHPDVTENVHFTITSNMPTVTLTGGGLNETVTMVNGTAELDRWFGVEKDGQHLFTATVTASGVSTTATATVTTKARTARVDATILDLGATYSALTGLGLGLDVGTTPGTDFADSDEPDGHMTLVTVNDGTTSLASAYVSYHGRYYSLTGPYTATLGPADPTWAAVSLLATNAPFNADGAALSADGPTGSQERASWLLQIDGAGLYQFLCTDSGSGVQAAMQPQQWAWPTIPGFDTAGWVALVKARNTNNGYATNAPDTTDTTVPLPRFVNP